MCVASEASGVYLMAGQHVPVRPRGEGRQRALNSNSPKQHTAENSWHRIPTTRSGFTCHQMQLALPALCSV